MRATGTGTVAHAGVVLPRLLADRLGLTSELAVVMDRAGFVPLRPRGRVLVDTACALAAGASCLTDVEAMTAQVEIFGANGGASDSTLWRVLEELSGRLGENGLPGRRFAAGMARVRSRAWQEIVARHGGLPTVRVAGRPLTRHPVDGAEGGGVVVIRLDATVIHAADRKEGSEPNFKGCGFHPLTGWCSNTGEALAVMQRRGSAGSFTAADHIAVLSAAIGQVPATHRRDLLVTVDGAGASHALIEHVTGLNTAPAHGGRGRRVEYSIGWPVDDRTRAALRLAPESAWGPALLTDGTVDEEAQVVDLTALLRTSMHGETLPSWPADLRVIARRTPRPVGQQPELGEDPNYRYGAFATNTGIGQVQWLDARHRTQA
ncbi:MAG: transposase, partial [Dermatophilaceae bacterium]